MRNAILTVLSDSRNPGFSKLPEVEVFLKSVKTVPHSDLVIFADQLNRPINHIPVPTSSNVILDRWLFYYRFLSVNESLFDQVLLIDSRDVYFQEDPFAHASDKVILSSEGVEHAISEWNHSDQELFQKETGKETPFLDWPVVNGGVVMGPPEKVRAYCLLIFTNSMGSPTRTDQAAINQLYNLFLKDTPDYSLADPRTDTFCVTGETLHREQLSTPTIFSDGKIRNEKGEPYTLFHQWERTPHREDILKLYQ